MAQLEMKKGFLEKNSVKIIGVLLFTLILILVALIPGIGHNAKVETAVRGPIAAAGLAEHVGMMRLFNGSLQASFNPLLYPISYLTGSSSIQRKFQGATTIWDYEGRDVAEMALLGTFTVEILRNFPYFLVAGFIITLLFAKLIKLVEKKNPGIWGRFLQRIRRSNIK